jgi:hypothetical protein
VTANAVIYQVTIGNEFSCRLTNIVLDFCNTYGHQSFDKKVRGIFDQSPFKPANELEHRLYDAVWHYGPGFIRDLKARLFQLIEAQAGVTLHDADAVQEQEMGESAMCKRRAAAFMYPLFNPYQLAITCVRPMLIPSCRRSHLPVAVLRHPPLHQASQAIARIRRTFKPSPTYAQNST